METKNKTKSSQEKNDEQALSLVMEVVTRARNKMKYKHLLKRLSSALDKAPTIQKVVAESLRDVGVKAA